MDLVIGMLRSQVLKELKAAFLSKFALLIIDIRRAMI